MATETEQICPLCRGAPCEVAYAMPCRHQFCLGCIMRWLDLKGECPLCREAVEIVHLPVEGASYSIGCFIVHPEESPDASSQAGTAPSRPAENSPHQPMASPAPSPQGTLSPDEQGTAGPEAEAVGGIMPEVWADLFQTEQHLLNPLLPWLRLQLWSICWPHWWQSYRAEANILHTLCVSGPVAEAMVQALQPDLGEYAALLVHSVINIIAYRCSQKAWRLLLSRDVQEEDGSSGAGSSSTSSQWGARSSHMPSSCSSAGWDRSEEAGTSEAVLCRDPGRPPSAPVPAEQEHPRRSRGRRRWRQVPLPRDAAAAPLLQAAAGTAPLRGLKRRAPSPHDSPPPCKRPPRRQH